MPARVLGRDGAVAPSETIKLGAIGIGPRFTYVLTSMLGLPDVLCVAITDVQKSRRDDFIRRDQQRRFEVEQPVLE